MKIHGCEPNPTESFTTKKTSHVACGFCYVVIGLDGLPVSSPVVYRGEDAADKFIKSMLDEQDKLKSMYENPEPLNLSPQEFRSFTDDKLCHICKKDLGDERVRDHCHITGKFRGAAHKSCNVQYKLRKRIPVIFHNLRGYDSHLIMQAIGKVMQKLNCIPNN